MLSLEGYYLSHTHAHTPFSVACNRWFYSHNACCIFKNNNNIKSLLLAATLMKRPIIRGALCFCSLFCWTLVSIKDLNQPKQSLSCRSCLALLTRKKKKIPTFACQVVANLRHSQVEENGLDRRAKISPDSAQTRRVRDANCSRMDTVRAIYTLSLL